MSDTPDLLARIAPSTSQQEALNVARSYLTLRCFRCKGPAVPVTRRLDLARPFAFCCPECKTRTAWVSLNVEAVIIAARWMRHGTVNRDPRFGTIVKGEGQDE